MVRLTASTRQPPAGGPGSTSDPDELLRGLRHGERDGFVRYFQLFRTPVYGFSLRLLHDEDAAVAATAEALSAAFRRVVLTMARSDLQALTYRSAYAACVARAAEAAGVAPAVGGRAGEGPGARPPHRPASRAVASRRRWTPSSAAARRAAPARCAGTERGPAGVRLLLDRGSGRRAALPLPGGVPRRVPRAVRARAGRGVPAGRAGGRRYGRARTLGRASWSGCGVTPATASRAARR